MMRRLLDFPESRERIDDRVDPEVRLAAITPGRDVVGRHHSGKEAPCCVDRTFDRFVLAALAERSNHGYLQGLGAAELSCKWSAEAWVITKKGIPSAHRQVLRYSLTASVGSTSFSDYGLGGKGAESAVKETLCVDKAV
jgi:hypothetical protein